MIFNCNLKPKGRVIIEIRLKLYNALKCIVDEMQSSKVENRLLNCRPHILSPVPYI